MEGAAAMEATEAATEAVATAAGRLETSRRAEMAPRLILSPIGQPYAPPYH